MLDHSTFSFESNDPRVNLVWSIVLLLTGNSIGHVDFQFLLHLHIPPIIMEGAQTMAWIGAFGLFVVSAIKFFTERKKKKDDNNNRTRIN